MRRAAYAGPFAGALLAGCVAGPGPAPSGPPARPILADAGAPGSRDSGDPRPAAPEPPGVDDADPDAGGRPSEPAPEPAPEPEPEPEPEPAERPSDPSRPTAVAGRDRRPRPLPAPLADAEATCRSRRDAGGELAGFSLPTLDGKDFTSRRARGSVLVINAWATWCRPCLDELPKLVRLARHYRGHGVRFVAVTAEDDRDAVADKLAERGGTTGPNLVHVYDGSALVDRFGPRALPFTVVVDRGGRVRSIYDGYQPECIPALELELRSLLEPG